MTNEGNDFIPEVEMDWIPQPITETVRKIEVAPWTIYRRCANPACEEVEKMCPGEILPGVCGWCDGTLERIPCGLCGGESHKRALDPDGEMQYRCYQHRRTI